MSHVFPRVLARSLPTAVRAEGVWIEDVDGKRYLDGAGGAIVVNVGHGDAEIARAMAEQAARVGYVHGTAFTTEALESYADELAPLLPMDEPRIYPVSGGSEAVETALKLARAYHLARGEPSRHRIIARWGSYHGNSRGALDASGRGPLRAPYLPWLGQALHVPPVYEYRCPWPRHPEGCGRQHAQALERAIIEAGAGTVAAFIAEPVAGATLGAAVPPDDYWPEVAEVCRRHGVLLIADEVMTGFGRTGTWFGCDHWAVRPDILVAGKGASSGYWPLGLCVASGEVFDTVKAGGFVHGFTYSHHAVGAAVGRAVLARLKADDLVERCRAQGELLRKELADALADHPMVGDVRGLGLMVGVELVQDRDSKQAHPRSEQVTERVVAGARERGLLLYSSTGCADGTNGDLVMLGPPFTISDQERGLLVERTAAAVAAGTKRR
ncbi:MAG: aspartate aminotransferase family protein [Actinomycetota bacterium]|nr:aspartate aminotransferase family protein [Actinomycetota bacterium]